MIKNDNNRKRFEREIENFLLEPSLSGTRMKVNRSDFIYFFSILFNNSSKRSKSSFE